ncbi:MAG: CoA ester lyase [Betaproteobacteria bacterium]|nr:MAG: CoA ester lyase [Betaproteobacteria bacterium]
MFLSAASGATKKPCGCGRATTKAGSRWTQRRSCAKAFDLEDAVTPEDKPAARSAIREFAASDRDRAASLLVRINDAATQWFDADLELLRAARVGGVLLPKTEHASHIERAAAALTADGIVIPIVETARGLLNIEELAAAPRVQRAAFGTVDYAVDLDLSGDERGFAYPACRIALASRAAGIASPIGGVTPEIGDEAKLLSDLAFARACGFGAKLCIHPQQVAAIHRALLPTEDEIAWARRVLVAADSGRGAAQVDGKMVDRPVVLKAKRILERAPH